MHVDVDGSSECLSGVSGAPALTDARYSNSRPPKTRQRQHQQCQLHEFLSIAGNDAHCTSHLTRNHSDEVQVCGAKHESCKGIAAENAESSTQFCDSMQTGRFPAAGPS